MSIAGCKRFKKFKAIFCVVEIIMFIGLAYLIYNAFVKGQIVTILVSGFVTLIIIFIILIKNQCELEKRKQEEIFQNIIHDFKTPLHSILGFIELSKLKLKQVEECQGTNVKYNEDMLLGISNNLDIINKEGIRLIQLSKEILNLTQLNMEKASIIKKKFAIGEFMSEIIPLLESLCIQKKLNYKVEIEDEEVIILGDEEKLIQVIYNLLSNAVKYTEEGYIKCGCFKKDSDMVFYVEDTGCGILNGNNKVFERFYTIKDDHRQIGNGIGLAICKDIVNLHNGQIWFESRLNIGTTFYFKIPIK